MHHTVGILIRAIWLVMLATWLVLAFRTKRTIQRQRGSLALVAAVLFFVVVANKMSQSSWAYRRLWHLSSLEAGLCVVVLSLGAAFAIWARLTLGANWSGTVTLKEDHELVQRGPYAYVRHPIYSGLLLMGLATTVFYAQAYEIIVLELVLVLFVVKIRMEERLMNQQFPSQYMEYRRHVKALIPFIV